MKVENHLTPNSPEITKKMVEQEVVAALDNKVTGAAAAGSVIRWARDTMAKPGVPEKLLDVARAIAAFETTGDKVAGAKEAFEGVIKGIGSSTPVTQVMVKVWVNRKL